MGSLYLSPPGEPNRERCGVVSAPRVSLSGLEPDYGIGGCVWRLQALKMGSSVEISTISPRGSFQRYGRDTGRTLQVCELADDSLRAPHCLFLLVHCLDKQYKDSL